ncbi:Gp2.5-like ssDNA binding protein and ssDNA annealing protein [Ralstonia phage RSB2]|uniref:Putative ssDNA binding protein n=1 Tax=Ralstonia phage RSB2 TaxID=913183 RepID=E5RV05_9CAUD|nr:Gp2.5-like ssDNA binding protein and ssDNA annealing protein [Ralstonia phage RSB2]BAJ51813.1 putative ssDNA binding protein [Ralstonia phage RSB2]
MSNAPAQATKPTTLVTPLATVFGFVNITKPDTKYKPEGEFKIRVKVPKEAAQDLYESLAQQAEAKLAEVVKRAKTDAKFKATLKGKAPKAADLPFYEDDEGNYVFTFKSKASFISKKPGSEGETINRTIPVWQGNKRLRPEDIPKFGEGSTVKVSFVAADFFTAAVGAGITLRLEAVKLIKAVEYTGGGSNPFGDEDGESDYQESEAPGNAFGDDDDGDGGTASEDVDF